MKLYYYDHCPFCTRAKMVAGYKQVPVEYIVFPATDLQKKVTDELSEVSSDINALLYPRNVKASLPEFATKSAIEYFQGKKEKNLGKSFDQAMSETAEHKKKVEDKLATLPFHPDNTNENLSWDDVMIFPTLRNLTIVKDIKMPQQLQNYVKHISALTGVQLYYDRAL